MSTGHQPDQEQDSIDRNARATALAATAQVAVDGTSRIGFESRGRLLVIGPAPAASSATLPLAEHGLAPCIIATAGAADLAGGPWPFLDAEGRELVIDGHLGAFRLLSRENEGLVNLGALLDSREDHFDLILDLCHTPVINLEIPPLGYFAAGSSDERLDRALRELPDLVGEFEKPRFFEYDPDICAHGRSGISGCRRCLDACPTGAITSMGERIEVNPYHCQGGGSCATACPTGAIIYSYPKPGDLLNRLRRLLRSFRETGGCSPALLFCDSEAGRPRLNTLAESLPGRVIPIEVEEIGSVGLDVWLGSLAFGASSVLILDTQEVADSVRREVDQQLEIAAAIVAGLGFPACVRKLAADTDGDRLMEEILGAGSMTDIPPAGFLGTSQKRDMIFLALDHLVAHAPATEDLLAMPAHAPFGQVEVDPKSCTLCMACVSICPASALSDGADKPELGFKEGNCVQCGLCASACPENAIELTPRLMLNRQLRRNRRVLHGEVPFACIVCGKPFATRSVIERMSARLSEHWMFKDDDALKRLQMCQDCRVKDMFEAERRR